MNLHCLATLGLSGGELGIAVIALIIFCGCKRPVSNFLEGLKKGASEAGRNVAGAFGKPEAEALTLDNLTVGIDDPPVLRDSGLSFDHELEREHIRRAVKFACSIFVGLAVVVIITIVWRFIR